MEFTRSSCLLPQRIEFNNGFLCQFNQEVASTEILAKTIMQLRYGPHIKHVLNSAIFERREGRERRESASAGFLGTLCTQCTHVHTCAHTDIFRGVAHTALWVVHTGKYDETAIEFS